MPGRRSPLDGADQQAGAEVENAFVQADVAVAHVEGLIVDEQADELAVGDVDDRLPDLRVAVAGLGVGQRTLLVEGVEVGAGQGVRIALVEIAAHSDVPVGQGEHRLGLGQAGQVEADLADVPGIDGVLRGAAHGRVLRRLFGGGVTWRCEVGTLVQSSSDRSLTTTSAPCAASAAAWPTRSTPMT